MKSRCRCWIQTSRIRVTKVSLLFFFILSTAAASFLMTRLNSSKAHVTRTHKTSSTSAAANDHIVRFTPALDIQPSINSGLSDGKTILAYMPDSVVVAMSGNRIFLYSESDRSYKYYLLKGDKLVLLKTYSFKFIHNLGRAFTYDYYKRSGRKPPKDSVYPNPFDPIENAFVESTVSPDGRKICFVKKKGSDDTPERDSVVIFDLEKGETKFFSTAASKYSGYDILISCEWKNRNDQVMFLAVGADDRLIDDYTYFIYSLPDGKISLNGKKPEMLFAPSFIHSYHDGIITISPDNLKTPEFPDVIPLADRTFKVAFKGKGTYYFSNPGEFLSDYYHWRFSEGGKFMLVSVYMSPPSQTDDASHGHVQNTNALTGKYFLFGFKSAKVYHIVDAYSKIEIAFLSYDEFHKVFIVTFNNSCGWLKKHENGKDCHDYGTYMIRAPMYSE